MENIGMVIEIIFFSTIGTVGVLLSIFAIPFALLFAVRYFVQSNKHPKGE